TEKGFEIQELLYYGNIWDPYRQAAGLLRASRLFGFFDHDKLMAAQSGIELSIVKRLRKESEEAIQNGKPLIFRYFLGDPKTVDRSDFAEQTTYYDDTVVGFINAENYGRIPLYIPGESVVFHRRHFHRKNILGKYNPGLINFNLQQAFENRW